MNNNSEANEWYRFAKMYANAASFLMEKRGPPYEAVCYLSGLSAECAMKGFLLERNPGIPLPDTHNLRELCQACAWFEDEFSSLLDDCEALGRFATPSGFPTLEKATQEDANQSLDTLQGVRAIRQSQEQSQGPTMTM